MIMRFGKYKGFPVEYLPTDYLFWLWREVDLREPLLSAVQCEIQDRADRINQDEEFSSCTAESEMDLGRIKQIYRKLAIKYHPDKGGTTEAMQAINEFYEELKQI